MCVRVCACACTYACACACACACVHSRVTLHALPAVAAAVTVGGSLALRSGCVVAIKSCDFRFEFSEGNEYNESAESSYLNSPREFPDLRDPIPESVRKSTGGGQSPNTCVVYLPL